MPNYRINIILEKQSIQEYVIEDSRKDIDLVYLDFRRRAYEKNGAGRVTYFDLVMIAEESLKHVEERKEILKTENNLPVTPLRPPGNRYTKQRKEISNTMIPLGDRVKM